MSITPAEFKTRFPEFDSVATARIQIFIDDAVIVLNSAFWGDKYDLGLHYLTAHYLTLGDKSATGASTSNAPVSSRSVDGASVGYAIGTSTDEAETYYKSTSYGQRYLALRKTLGVASVVI